MLRAVSGTRRTPHNYRMFTVDQQDRNEQALPTPSPLLPWIVAVGFFMQMLDSTIVNTALPKMAEEMNVAPLRMQSVIIAYMLTTAIIIPTSGWLADRFEAKRIFVFSICVFTIGSFLCAISPTLSFMVMGRIVQGIGGALMVPVGRLIALRAYPRNKMVSVLSFITLPGLIGPLLGPTAGGFLVEYASWHWIFLINLPVGVAGCILAVKFMPNLPAASDTDHFDGLGFVLFGCSMVFISMAMEGLGELHLPKVEATLLCIVGLGSLALYWLRAVRIPYPLFSPTLFHTRAFSVGILDNVFSRLGSGAMPFLLSLFLQLVLGFTPFQSGMTMIPGALASFVGKGMIATLIKRFGFRNFLIVNTLAIGIMFFSFALLNDMTHYGLLLAQLFVFGIFNSMQFTAMNTVTLYDLSDKETGPGNSMLSVTMQISAGCGVAIAAALLDGFMSRHGIHPGRDHLMYAFKATFVCIGALSVVTSVIFGQLPASTGREEKPAEKTPTPASQQTPH